MSEAEEEIELNSREQEQVEEHSAVPTGVVYEAIRRAGLHELERSASGLWWSGVAAGIALSVSVLAEGVLHARLPDTSWSPLVAAFGYSIGFLIVVQARMQLFTENTITPILPVFLNPSLTMIGCLLRLWAVVLVANLVGCAVAAGAMSSSGFMPDDLAAGVMEIARGYAELTPGQQFLRGIPAGFLIAALVWIMPRQDGSGEILVIVVLTWTIAVAEMSHVIAGSTKLFLLAFEGELPIAEALLNGTLPALAGNVIGGTVIFSALAYAQVRERV
ncbi:formate/nitrite transporter family protein [Albimonas sp. CAU 1670]|uniref:formate/nitrite transporter family protein n=1 Tax=Albimonas sp. CAU 1670 TaxID=3032599 RepID=UPI0023DA91E2|nr:formate/nitrite transporter family protein [Albimonas sp. CAU 1670]MDF2232123.1 formate/nitrite transporter family protein [Albimonas sp. CAU 1670]